MRMLYYNHRVQILLDDDRFQRITGLARERRVSVATILRDAIDRGLPAADEKRRAAARRILAAPEMPVPDPAELRAELDELRGRHA